MSRWFLVRHAQTTWNAEEKIQGRTDTPLSDWGYEQAKALASRLAEREIDAAYVSDLTRAQETARVILQGRNIPLTPSLQLRERSYGRWEGLTFEVVARDYPEEFAKFRNSTDAPPPGGESTIDMEARVGQFASGLKLAHQDSETLLIVGHRGCLNALIAHLLDLPAIAAFRFTLGSASLTMLEWRGDRAVLRLLGDTSHWDGKL